jgi:hypothetical protein
MLGPHPRTVGLARGKRIIVGQDVHHGRHFSRLFLECRTGDILAELREESWSLSAGGRLLAPRSIRNRPLRQALQVARAPLIRWTVGGIKRARQLRRSLAATGLASLGGPR